MAWTNLTFSYGATLTAAQMTQVDDNLDAIALGLSGAPTFDTAAFTAANVTYVKCNFTGSLQSSDLATGAVEGSMQAIAAGTTYNHSWYRAHDINTSASYGGTHATASYDRGWCCKRSGTYRIQFSIKTSGGTAYGRVYKNGAAIGIERSTTSTSFVAQATEDFALASGDYIEVLTKTGGAGTSYSDEVKITSADTLLG